ncbi:MAG: phosphatidate cytidylyltransferase [Planctomycetota bacterium]
MTATGRPMIARIIVGAVLIGVIVALLWLDVHFEDRTCGMIIAPVIGLLVLVAFIEVHHLLKTKGLDALWISGGMGSVALATLPVWWQWVGEYSVPAGHHVLMVISGILILIFLDQMARRSIDAALSRISATALTVLYLGVGGALVLTVRLYYGMDLLILFLATIKATDIGAYFVGSMFGKHALVKHLSPNKSWEGLLGGLAAGLLVGLGLHWILDVGWAFWNTLVFALAMGLAGQFGDLCESLLKRSAAVKDSGRLLPEFGGVLDMLDSVLLAAPVALLLLEIWG